MEPEARTQGHACTARNRKATEQPTQQSRQRQNSDTFPKAPFKPKCTPQRGCDRLKPAQQDGANLSKQSGPKTGAPAREMQPSPPPRRPPVRTGTGRCNTHSRGTNHSEGQGPKEAELTSARIALQGKGIQEEELDGHARTRKSTVATQSRPSVRTGSRQCDTTIRGKKLSKQPGPKTGAPARKMQLPATPASPICEDGDAAVRYQLPRDKS